MPPLRLLATVTGVAQLALTSRFSHQRLLWTSVPSKPLFGRGDELRESSKGTIIQLQNFDR